MKTLRTAAALLLALSLLAFGLVGCASHGKTFMTAGDTEISLNVFQLYLSRMKGSLAAAGNDVTSDAFWNTYVSVDNMTQADYYTQQVFEGLRQIAAALILYDELGLKLDSAAEDEIDEWIDTLIEQVGEGSKTQLNAVLAEYGANVTVLRDAAIIEAKIDQLKTYLYGENGSLVAATAREEFYRATYYRGRQMLIANYYYEHDRDADGRTVYYTVDESGNLDRTHIAYDKDGEGVTAAEEEDANGETVYRRADGLVAYDEENGRPNYHLDENGERIVAEYTDEEMASRLKIANSIAENCVGNEALFLEFTREYGDNSDFNATYAPNGMYFSAGSYAADTIFYTFATELAKLEVGELVVLDSDSGYYILMRVDLDTGAWAEEANSRWFSTMDALVVEYMLQNRVAEYLDRVEIDEELKKSADIRAVAPNYYY